MSEIAALPVTPDLPDEPRRHLASTSAVMIVSPHESDHEAWRQALAAAGEDMMMHSAYTGRDAIDLCRDQRIDCAVVDYLTPDYDGLCLLNMLRNGTDYAKVPVVMVAEQQHATVGLDAMRQGAQDFLIKEKLHPAQMLDTVTHALERVRWLRAINAQRQQINHQVLELQRREEQHNRAQQDLGHAVLTPLASLQEFISLVLDGVAGPINDTQGKYLAYARGCCQDIQRTIAQTVGDGHAPTVKEPLHTSVALDSLLSEILAEHEIEAKLKGIHIGFSCADNLPIVKLDTYEFRQLFGHLLGYALEVSGNGSSILVLLEEEMHANRSLKVTLRANPNLSERITRQHIDPDASMQPFLTAVTSGEYIVDCSVEDGVQFSFNVPLNANAR